MSAFLHVFKKNIHVIILLLLASLVVIWLSVGAYQSHYLSALRILGDNSTQALLGAPKEGRGDEWSTYLPLLKQAYLEGFPEKSSLEPYRERLEWFIAIPHFDMSLIFLPNYLAYWLVSGGKAISFQGLYYNILLLLSVFWLLKNLKIGAGVAAAAAVMMLFSHLYQVWWTSNFPSLGASILPFAVLTSGFRWLFRGPLLAWSIGHMLFGQMYPPFYFSLMVAVLPFIVAAKPELMRWNNLLGVLVSVSIPCVAFVGYKIGYIEAVAATSYPGLRISTGGDATLSTLLGVFLPTYPASSQANVGETLYELSVVGSCFTLLAIALVPAVQWSRETVRVTLVSLAVLLILTVYMLFGMPSWLARATGFFIAPGRRVQLGFSVLVLLLSAFLVSRSDLSKSPKYIISIFLAYAVASCFLPQRGDVEGQFWGISNYYCLPILFIAVSGAISLAIWRGRNLGPVMVGGLLGGMAVSHIVIFGSFNPIMRGSDIMRPVDSQLVRDWKELYKMNDHRPLAVIGNYGHLLRGEGLPALEAIHLVNVDPDIYGKLFPELGSSGVRRVFNQFRGIAFDNISSINDSGATVKFPIRPYSVSFSHSIEQGRRTGSGLTSHVDVTEIKELIAGKYLVFWSGILERPLLINAHIVLRARCKIESSWLTRFPLQDPLVVGHGASLRGVVGEVQIIASSKEEASECVKSIQVDTLDSVSSNEVVLSEAVELVDDVERKNAAWSGRSCDINASQPATLYAGEVNTLTGYLIAPDNEPAGNFTILLRGKVNYKISAATGISRKDVAGYFKNPALEFSGFKVVSNFSSVKPGRYFVDFLMLKNKKHYFCESGKTIEILRGE